MPEAATSRGVFPALSVCIQLSQPCARRSAFTLARSFGRVEQTFMIICYFVLLLVPDHVSVHVNPRWEKVALGALGVNR